MKTNINRKTHDKKRHFSNIYKKNYGSQQEGYGRAFLQKKLVVNRYRHDQRREESKSTSNQNINYYPEEAAPEFSDDEIDLNEISKFNIIQKSKSCERIKKQEHPERTAVINRDQLKTIDNHEETINDDQYKAMRYKQRNLKDKYGATEYIQRDKDEYGTTVNDQCEDIGYQQRNIDQAESSGYQRPNSYDRVKDKKLSKFKRAQIEYKTKLEEKEEKKQAREAKKLEVEEAMASYKKKKFERFKKLSKKTKKGQPVMSGRMELLLESIQEKFTKR